jgi:hypothetical protein
MSKIFISYNRDSIAMARSLVNDIELLGFVVWFDQELSGGQAWWDRILAMVRECDVFVFLLDPRALNSTACQREFGYAADLDKPILPVLVADGVSTNLLPPELSRLQFIDYRKQDRQTAFSLARALTGVPPPKPLPNPLPPAPEVPVSYLGSLTRKIDTASTLSYEDQSALLVNLKRGLRDPTTADDTRTLLKRLRNRHDLFAAIADEIDELLGSSRQAWSVSAVGPATEHPPVLNTPAPQHTASRPPQDAAQPTTLPQRLLGAFLGAAAGALLGGLAVASTDPGAWYIGAAIAGTAGAVTGAITGTQWKVVSFAIAGLFLVFCVWAIADHGGDRFVDAVVFGAPIGAILGAIAGAIMKRKRQWT